MNYIYKARILGKEISITKIKIIKETPKQYKIEGGYSRTINKYMINTVDNYGATYALSKEKAIELLKDSINKEIKRHEELIERRKKELNYPIKEEF